MLNAPFTIWLTADSEIWIRPSALILIAVLVLVPLSVAWIEARLWGPPFITPNPAAMPGAASGPHDFPTKMKSTSICCLVFDAIHHMGAQVAHWARAKYQCQDLYW